MPGWLVSTRLRTKVFRTKNRRAYKHITLEVEANLCFETNVVSWSAMPDELSELHENAEHAKHDPSLAPVTLTMAVLAVLVATASLLGHRSSVEEVVLQNKVTDQWAFYQAKNI